MGPGGLWWFNVLNSALPPQTLRPDTQPEHQDPVSHMVVPSQTLVQQALTERILILMFKDSPEKSLLMGNRLTRSFSRLTLLMMHQKRMEGKSEKQCYLMFYFIISVSAYSRCLIYLHMCTHTQPVPPRKQCLIHLTSDRLGVAMTMDGKKYTIFLILKLYLLCLAQCTLKNKTEYDK